MVLLSFYTMDLLQFYGFFISMCNYYTVRHLSIKKTNKHCIPQFHHYVLLASEIYACIQFTPVIVFGRLLKERCHSNAWDSRIFVDCKKKRSTINICIHSSTLSIYVPVYKQVNRDLFTFDK